MMQAFLLDVPAGGNWWNTLSTKVTAQTNAGIGSIWPASKKHKTVLSLWI
jgi:alpha-amylase